MKEFLKDLLDGAKAVSKFTQSYHLYLVHLLRKGAEGDTLKISNVYMAADGVVGEISVKTPDDGSIQMYDFIIKKQDWYIKQDDGHPVIDERGVTLYFDTKEKADEAAREFNIKGFTLDKRR